MANLTEITAYKSRMMQTFCTSSELTPLLSVEGEEEMTGKALMYSRVFPYAHVPNTVENAKSFVCFKVDALSVKSDVIKTIQITIYCISHQNLLRLPDGRGLRTDVMASLVDKLMNGSSEYGLGTVELISSKEFNPITNYCGRESVYRVKDFNRDMCEVFR